MTKYEDCGYGNRDNDVNEDGNDDNNATSGSGSYGPIFYPIKTPRSCRVVSGDGVDRDAAAVQYVSTRRTIYIPYKYHSKYVP